MTESIRQKLGFVVAAAMLLAGLAVLNVGGTSAASTECEADGGSESPSPTPTESEEPFPPSLPPIIPGETSESPSPTESGGDGQARRCDSEISINYKGPSDKNMRRSEFTGTVRSDERACEAGRKVLVKKKKSGKDRTVDTTVTNNRGRYRAPVKRANGRYYAQTPQERAASDEGRVTCGSAQSKTIRV